MPQPEPGTTDGTATGRQQVAADVLARLDDLARDVTAEIVHEIPAYAVLSPDQLGEVGAIATWGTTRVLGLWAAGGTDLTEADVRRFRGIGTARALDGRPLPGVLRAYRLAAGRIVDHVEAVAGRRLSVGDAMALARLWMVAMDTLTEALYEGYGAGTARVSGDRARAVGDLVDDLLVGRQVTRTNVDDRCRELGITLPARPAVLVVQSADPTDAVSADALGEALGDDRRTALRRTRGRAAVALVDAGPEAEAAPDAVRRGVQQRGWRAVAVRSERLTDLPRCLRLAEHALAHAPAHAFAARTVLEEADVQLVALLSGHRDGDADRFRALALGPLGAQGLLLEGLRAFFAEGSATDAATRLGLHPQTLRYRLRRARELSGRDPRRPWDHLVLQAALTVRSGPPT
ncbi:PucR family transcriptional regulator [Nocardioides alkalitolerans]|uniref:PucR family transcriptional regulator n=1 Tax=Nocardioides alkalitolerans TaxID=281714 RepID=UPI0004027C64|nr:helix-turn-helix domain-containing protein [Nocardioides alkalitolerans]